jgi:acid stress-induced BolA-like protein IbaG/YrbA
LENEAVAKLIRAGIQGAEVQVTGDGSHFEAIIVSDIFDGLTPIKRERLVMEAVREQVASGELHALSVKAMTPAQWAAKGI